MPAVAATCSCCSTSVDWWVRLRSYPDLPICHVCLAGLNGQRDGQLQLMKGQWLVTGLEPISKVADVARSVAWFERGGFEVSFHGDTYAFAHRDKDLTINLAQAGEARLRATDFSTSTVKAPHGWLRSGDSLGSEWTARATRTTASAKASSPTPTETSFVSVALFAEGGAGCPRPSPTSADKSGPCRRLWAT